MKEKELVNRSVLTFACLLFSLSATACAAQERAYKVGDKGPAGGLVFYDKGETGEGWRYLEAAPSDTSSGIQWREQDDEGGGEDIEVKTGDAIGTGKANTIAIITTLGGGSYAAQICDALVMGGFNDWFLPSIDELNLMYQNLMKAGLGDFGGGWYWSSSQKYNEDYGSFVGSRNFSDGDQDNYADYLKYRVRAVRAF